MLTAKRLKKKGTYLSRVPEDRRKWPRRPTSLVVRIAFTRQGIRQLVGVQATIVDISEGGAALISRNLEAIPEHFYIVLGKMEIMIACSCVSIANDVMHVRFIKDQPSEFIDRLAEIPFPLAMLQPLDNNGYKGLRNYAKDSAVRYA